MLSPLIRGTGLSAEGVFVRRTKSPLLPILWIVWVLTPVLVLYLQRVGLSPRWSPLTKILWLSGMYGIAVFFAIMTVVSRRSR